MKFLLDADDDWQEGLRRFWFPRFHPILSRFGLFSIGVTDDSEFVARLDLDPELFEEILVDLGFERNPIACYKTDTHGCESIGSWVLRSHDDDFGLLERDRQLHVVLFPGIDGRLEVCAHNELDWQDAPLGHLRKDEFQPHEGAEQMLWILTEHTYLDLYDVPHEPRL